MHSFVTRSPRLLFYACPLRAFAQVACAALYFKWLVHTATTRYAGLPRTEFYLLVCFVVLYNSKPETLRLCQTEEMWACTQTLLHTNLPCVLWCSQTALHSLVHIQIYTPDVSAEWWVGGSFCPLRSLRCFCSPTHPPLNINNTSISISSYGHTPSPNWLGSRISPKLEWEKRWVSAIRNLQSCLWCTCCTVMFLFSVWHVLWFALVIYLEILHLRIVQRLFAVYARVWFCVGGLGN